MLLTHTWIHVCCTMSPQFCLHHTKKLYFPTDHFVYAPSQWEMMLHCNVICHLLGTYTKWSLQWHHNGPGGISNHQPHDCLLKRLFGRWSKKTSKLCVTGLCVGNSPVTGEFPAQRASNVENFSIWWRHHDPQTRSILYMLMHRQIVSPRHQKAWYCPPRLAQLVLSDGELNINKTDIGMPKNPRPP